MSEETLEPVATQTGTKRIEYIDALRGFTMFLVVAHHVSNLCFQVIGKGISITGYLLQVRMPLFFFISGFVLYKASVVWDFDQIVRFFKKKIPVQLISPFIFFVIFSYTHHKDIVEGMFADGKYGYWFTYILFVYFVIYAAVRFLIRNKYADIILVIIGICLYPLHLPQMKQYIPLPDTWLSFLSIEHWYYFIFFVTGTLVKKYFNKVEELLDGRYMITICLAIYFLVNVFRKALPIFDIFMLPVLSLTGIAIIFSFFRKKQALFTKDTVLGCTLQYMGRRTLDIYLIHYFLIPYNLSIVTLFVDHPMPIIEATVSSLIAALIIAGCLLFSNIIRLSPFWAHWLFGVKNKH